MYSRNIISVLYIAAIVLFAILAQVVSAAPSGQNLTPGQVVTMNRLRSACRLWTCYNVNAPNITDTSTSPSATSVPSAPIPEATVSVDTVPEDSSVPVSSSSSPNVVADSDAKTNAAHHQTTTIILPAVIAVFGSDPRDRQLKGGG
ncbi:hypothetical protein BU17DRAFT_63571 [Hysterangium stoloniferum]|nr:hypothetical protein BU17DRAFT_63571 [Hysterangium stoloniferum]